MTQQPPYRPPGYSPVFEPSGGLGTAVIVMAVTWTVIRWLLALAAVLTASGTPVGFIVYNIFSALLFLVCIATFVLVGFWLGQARRNADRIAPDQQRLSRVWVWLGWIVPVVIFWFPREVVDDVWRSTVRDPAEPRTDWWWVTWIATGVVGVVTQYVALLTGSIGQIVSDVITAAMTTVGAIFWLRVVRTISHAQDTLAGKGITPY